MYNVSSTHSRWMVCEYACVRCVLYGKLVERSYFCYVYTCVLVVHYIKLQILSADKFNRQHARRIHTGWRFLSFYLYSYTANERQTKKKTIMYGINVNDKLNEFTKRAKSEFPYIMYSRYTHHTQWANAKYYNWNISNITMYCVCG